MIDGRKPWFKLTNVAAAVIALGQVAALIWPAHAAICQGIAAIALPLLGVGIARRISRASEAANGDIEE